MPYIPDPSPFHRVVVYYQTQIYKDANGNNQYLSPAPLKSLATHLIIAAFHLNAGASDSDPKTITLNNLSPDDSTLTQMWIDVARLQGSGVKIMGMLGGWGEKSYQDLTTDFDDYYALVSSCIKAHRLDGIDLDVETSNENLDDIGKLIQRLRADFSKDFIITLTPVASALKGGANISGFSYTDLESSYGNDINWYNAQFYGSNFGSMSTTTDYSDIVTKFPLDPSRLVAIVPTKDDDFSTLDTIKSTLRQLLKMYGSSFGGIAAWEYYNSMPDTTEPWTWAALMKVAMMNWKEVLGA